MSPQPFICSLLPSVRERSSVGDPSGSRTLPRKRTLTLIPVKFSTYHSCPSNAVVAGLVLLPCDLQHEAVEALVVDRDEQRFNEPMILVLLEQGAEVVFLGILQFL